MKKIFPGYYKKTKKELNELWENGLICFDANVLLNLYRYSDETRNELLKLIEKLSDKIWLPHQAALEYNRNRYEVIAEQEKAYKEFISKINQIEEDLKSSSKPPFLSEKIHSSLKKIFKEVNKEVENSISKYRDYFDDDYIYNKLSDIFKKKISEPFNDEELEKLYKEGEERFKNKIPPGYEDEKNKQGVRKYGDFILWKQIINKAKEEKKPVILITDERKEDWWWKIKDGRNMGPRQELIAEIKKEAEVDFHMYSSERFLTYGSKFLKEQIQEKALKEIKELTKAEIEKTLEQEILKRRTILEKRNKELEQISDKIDQLKNKINSIKHRINIYSSEKFLNPEQQDRVIEYILQQQMLEEELEKLQKERRRLLKDKFNDFNYIRKFYDFDNE